MSQLEALLNTPDRVNIGLSMIAESGDGDLGRLLAEYDEDFVGRRLALIDLFENQSAYELIEPSRARTAAHERWRPRWEPKRIERIEQTMARLGIWSLSPGDDDWPMTLRDLGVHAPVALFGRGDAALLSAKSIAVIGARAATSYGEHVTMSFVPTLSDAGYVIVSGGAYGIDGAAHRTALASDGKTIAFLAGGVDRFYPMGHESLLQRITETGLVVSEVTPGSAPTKWRFLQRNRLIAALADGTLVVEAGIRSGSLNTAGHAAAYDRPLFAVPGPITSPASAGCHRLLREYDAELADSPEVVLEYLDNHIRNRELDAVRIEELKAKLTTESTDVVEAKKRCAAGEHDFADGICQAPGCDVTPA